MKEIIFNLGLNVKIERASYKDFSFVGIKNTCTPIKSIKIEALRPWRGAVKEYCFNIRQSYIRE